jgi:IS66 Orf2 like protein
MELTIAVSRVEHVPRFTASGLTCTGYAKRENISLKHCTGYTLIHSGCVIAQVYLCVDRVDFCKSIDGLLALVEQRLSLKLFAPTLFVYMNRGAPKSTCCTGIVTGSVFGTNA